MTIKEQYRKVRRAYLSRVRYYRKRGYIINIIPIPKRITRASIRRLERMTGARIKATAVGFQDMLTGMKIVSPKASERRRIERQNLDFLLLRPEEQYISRTVGKIVHLPEDLSADIMSPTQSYEDLIDKWYQQIEHYRPDIYRRVEMKTNELIEGKGKEVRRRFAYVLWQDPDVFPTAEDSTAEIIDMKMQAVLRIMDIAEGSEAYYDFLSLYDSVEEERE